MQKQKKNKKKFINSVKVPLIEQQTDKKVKSQHMNIAHTNAVVGGDGKQQII
jgi:hypothetical protein